jgi:hypothetical protein
VPEKTGADAVSVRSIKEISMAASHSKERTSEGIALTAQQHTAGPSKANGIEHAPLAHAQDATIVPDHASSEEHLETHDQRPQASFLARGKDVLSAEVGGVATAAVIGIGAALIEVELIPGLLIGAGAILLGKMFPEVASQARPMLKGVVRAGLAAGQKLREVMAEAKEEVHDLVAEVKHEREIPPAPAQSATVQHSGAAATQQAH